MADNTTASETKIHQLLVTLLESKTLILNYATPQVSVNDIKHSLYEVTKIPPFHQRLITGTRQLEDNSVISCSSGSAQLFPTVRLTLRLRGGKGGFGSLLRGAATKAGQKKTSNFDACRDMSGRRLRHVNAEKRLEEWKAEEEDRRLEKKAEDFLKKMAKKGKKGVGDGAAEKYVAQYREQSERCVLSVLDSVSDAVKGKRKKVGVVGKAAEAKRVKIWMGKRKLGESDSDVSDEDEKENETSTVLNRDSHSDSSKEAQGSLDSVTGGNMGGVSCESGSEEEKEIVVQETIVETGGFAIGNSKEEQNNVMELDIVDEKMVQTSSPPCSEPAVVAGTEVISTEKIDRHPEGCGQGLESTLLSNADCSLESSQESGESNASQSIVEKEKPLNFDEFNSAAELESLGMEKLKCELQTHGLKCGGTLQERAARLFMLKSTPLERLPKKLLAKK